MAGCDVALAGFGWSEPHFVLPVPPPTANRRLLEGFQTAHCNASPASISGNATFDHLQLLEETPRFSAARCHQSASPCPKSGLN